MVDRFPHLGRDSPEVRRTVIVDSSCAWLAVHRCIEQLGGVPNLDPNGISTRAFSKFASGHTLAELLKEDLLAERVVIKMYSDIVNFFGQADPVSRRMFEEILKDEEDHADEVADLLYTVDPETGRAVEQFTGDSTFKRADLGH